MSTGIIYLGMFFAGLLLGVLLTLLCVVRPVVRKRRHGFKHTPISDPKAFSRISTREANSDIHGSIDGSQALEAFNRR